MKITKFSHACLLVETPDRVALFDPGMMSVGLIPVDNLTKLDDIIITHGHGDHLSQDLLKQLIAKFPDVRITAPSDVVAALAQEAIVATDKPSDGIVFFNAPHEDVTSMYGPAPEEIGVHYLDTLSHPGDSHSFSETKSILALPITGPWGSPVKALNIALELRPKHVLPIHDWHWSDAARADTYQLFETTLAKQGITFCKLADGQPIEIDA